MRNRVMKWCRDNECGLTDQPGFRLTVWLPSGKVIAGTESHSAFASLTPGCDKRWAWDQLWQDIASGLTDCREGSSCECCNPDDGGPFSEIPGDIHADEIVLAPDGWRERHAEAVKWWRANVS